MAGPFRFENDISRATTIPADWYTDPAILEQEKTRLFLRTWQLVGYTSQLAGPGDCLSADVAGEPLLVVRGEDQALHAFSAVCRHRAGPVAGHPERRGVLRCGYHGWTYGLDGRLLGTPDFEGVRDFDRGTAALPPLRVEAFASLVFVNLDPTAHALSESLGSIVSETAGLELERMAPCRRVDYEVGCNWKVYVDNYLEGYHIPIVHPRLFRELDYSAYRVETRALHSRQHAPLRSPSRDSVYGGRVDPGREPAALYYWLFPNVMLNVYPDNVQVNVVVPLAPERTLTRFEWLVPEPGRPGLARDLEGSLALADEVQREDIAICEAVQRGLRSRTYDRGRFSVRRENGVHHFHRLLAAAVGGGDAPPSE